MSKQMRGETLDQLHGNLNRLAGGGRWFLQRWRLRAELRSAAAVALYATFVLPLLFWLVQLTRGLMGQVTAPVSPWIILGLAVLGPVLYMAVRLVRIYYRYHPRRHNALALYDEELKTADRLVTADEFLHESGAADDRSLGFKRAAVADADGYARSALTAALSPLSLPQWHLNMRSLLGVLAAAVVAWLLYFGIDGTQIAKKADERAMLAAAEVMRSLEATPEERAAAQRQLRRLQQKKREQQLAQQDAQPSSPSKNRKSRNEKGSEGESNNGNSTVAQSSSTSSNSAGQPSSQKNASKPKKPEEEQRPEPDNKEDKKKPKKKEEQKTTQLAMSATSGEGKMSMSNSNLGEFDMPEEEDKAAAGDKQSGEDQESEDEDEQEKANSASTPTVVNRQAPQNRNLTPSMNFPPSDKEQDPTNGRGPAGQRKKTRGVSSMILGLPIPDRVKGTPNAGRSKVTQENAKPKEETHQALEAQLRLARSEKIGEVEHPDLMPWMRTLIKGYFMTLRQAVDSQDTPASSPAETPIAAVQR